MQTRAILHRMARMPRQDDADLGGIGEATLAAWAHEVGISPTRSTHDVKGWDYVLVLPKPVSGAPPASPLDLEPPEFTCLVQVKATRDATQSIGVKLSNWQRLATAPLPAFFFVVEVGSSSKPRRAFLVHVGEAWITKVLKRLRSVPPAEHESIHRRSLKLAIASTDALPTLDGAALLVALRKHAGKSAYDYVTAKKRWLETVGYDERRYRVTLTFGDEPADDLYETMADFAIGALKKMPAKRYRVREARFGVPSDLKDVEAPIFLELPDLPPRAEAAIEVTDAAGLDVVCLAFKVYPATTIFPFLPPKYRKVALKSDGVTLVAAPIEHGGASRDGLAFGLSMRFHLPDEEETRPLGCAPAAAKLARMVSRGPARFAFVTSAKRIEFAEAHDEKMPDGFLNYARAIENADLVMRYFGVPPETRVTFGDLLDQEDRLRLLAVVATPGAAVPGATTVTFPSHDSPSVETEKAAIVLVVWVTFGDRALLVVPVALGRPSWATGADGAPQMSLSGRPEVRLTRVLSVQDAERLDVRPLLDRVMQGLHAEGVQVVVGPPRRQDAPT